MPVNKIRYEKIKTKPPKNSKQNCRKIQNCDISDATISSYIEVLENLFVIRDIDAWTPQIRSKTAILQAEKSLLKFETLIEEHNKKVMQDETHPGVRYRKPETLIIICANADMAYTTESGVKIIPAGCLRE